MRVLLYMILSCRLEGVGAPASRRHRRCHPLVRELERIGSLKAGQDEREEDAMRV